ncbi:MAG TPA: Hpt domain-containing protein [Pirellulales bacterium]|nr:Hpt domain-containing protein [Pirellulales bacterium]
MSDQVSDFEPLVSALAQDPDLGDIVALYVAEMPDRMERLRSQVVARDWAGVANCAHQLKGSAGSHGFHQITPFAEALERAARELRDEAEVIQAFEALAELCRRVR